MFSRYFVQFRDLSIVEGPWETDYSTLDYDRAVRYVRTVTNDSALEGRVWDDFKGQVVYARAYQGAD